MPAETSSNDIPFDSGHPSEDRHFVRRHLYGPAPCAKEVDAAQRGNHLRRAARQVLERAHRRALIEGALVCANSPDMDLPLACLAAVNAQVVRRDELVKEVRQSLRYGDHTALRFNRQLDPQRWTDLRRPGSSGIHNRWRFDQNLARAILCDDVRDLPILSANINRARVRQERDAKPFRRPSECSRRKERIGGPIRRAKFGADKHIA